MKKGYYNRTLQGVNAGSSKQNIHANIYFFKFEQVYLYQHSS